MHDGQNLWAALPQLAFAATWNVDTAFDNASNTGACSSGGRGRVGRAAARGHGGDLQRRQRLRPAGSARRSPRPSSSASPTAPTASTSTRRRSTRPRPTPAWARRAGPTSTCRCSSPSSSRRSTAMLRHPPRRRVDGDGGQLARRAGDGLRRLKHPDVYGRIAELSPSSWWDSDVIVERRPDGTRAAPARPLVVYVDSGDRATASTTRPDTDLLAVGVPRRSATSTGRTSATWSSRARSTARPTGPSAFRGRCSSSSG